MARLANHGSGTALVFARTETRWFVQTVWRRASALLFLEGRLTFHHGDGTASKVGHNSGGPSVLVAYGDADWGVLAVATATLKGSLVRGWNAC